MLEGNPALLALKTLQVVSEGKNTVILGAPGTVIPVSTPTESPKPGSGRPSPDASETDQP